MQKTALYKALGLTLGAVLMSACSSTGEVNEGAASSEPTAIEEQVAEQGQEAQTQAVESGAVVADKLEAEANAAQTALLEMTVFYFGFDQSSLAEDGKDALKAHAAYLAANPSARVVLEGHADERGTVEYNLALGERRAMAVRRFLMANNAQAGQLQVVSFGEERPAVVGQNDASWAKNRRVEVKYQSR
ncbi:MAG: peptidoglycan-associated lipoprotein Pal [Saccharospirillaceae bacterium]|jgi:peptidoglycan-associated lipoprotein|nr:peptidoglycan-associated lipoprotein [Thalassolituus sp. HI0120]MCH2039598.1 peptidoglycan-associated lipoprotein Pal [Saccharospirillaceae bacterium]